MLLQTPVAYIATSVRNEASLQLFMQAAAEAQLAMTDCAALLNTGAVRFRHRLRPAGEAAVVLHALAYAHAQGS